MQLGSAPKARGIEWGVMWEWGSGWRGQMYTPMAGLCECMAKTIIIL